MPKDRLLSILAAKALGITIGGALAMTFGWKIPVIAGAVIFAVVEMLRRDD